MAAENSDVDRVMKTIAASNKAVIVGCEAEFDCLAYYVQMPGEEKPRWMYFSHLQRDVYGEMEEEFIKKFPRVGEWIKKHPDYYPIASDSDPDDDTMDDDTMTDYEEDNFKITIEEYAAYEMSQKTNAGGSEKTVSSCPERKRKQAESKEAETSQAKRPLVKPLPSRDEGGNLHGQKHGNNGTPVDEPLISGNVEDPNVANPQQQSNTPAHLESHPGTSDAPKETISKKMMEALRKAKEGMLSAVDELDELQSEFDDLETRQLDLQLQHQELTKKMNKGVRKMTKIQRRISSCRKTFKDREKELDQLMEKFGKPE